MAEDSTSPVIDVEKLKARPQVRVRTPDFSSMYSSSANIEATFNDVQLFFGQITEATAEKVVMEERIAIIMTPEQAASLMRALQIAVRGYESAYGPIRHPPGEPS